MRTCVALMLPALATLVSTCSPAPDSGEARRAEILDAVNRDICFGSFWYGDEYKLGAHVAAYIVDRGNAVDVWSTDVTTGLLRSFLTKFTVEWSNGVPVASVKSWNPTVFTELRVPAGASPITLQLPADCTARRPTKTRKFLMVERLAAQEFSTYREMRLSGFGPGTKIIIANVDDRYPKSFVYVPGRNELFETVIPPGSEKKPWNPVDYAWGQRNDANSMVPPLVTYGIERRIP